MIENVRWAWFWARSGGTNSATQTIGIPTQNVIAQASLSKVDGAGSAKAFIRQYCYMHSPDQRLCAVSPNADDAPSVATINNCTSVTFEVQVNNAYGYGTGLVFIRA
jgi:hypothetical protein